MAWNLHKAALPDGAKQFLAELCSCGDEHEAARRMGISGAEIHRWSRDEEFVEHHRHALAHFESWKDWRPPSREPDDRRFIPLEEMTGAQLQTARWQSLGRRTESIDPGPAGRLDK